MMNKKFLYTALFFAMLLYPQASSAVWAGDSLVTTANANREQIINQDMQKAASNVAPQHKNATTTMAPAQKNENSQESFRAFENKLEADLGTNKNYVGEEYKQLYETLNQENLQDRVPSIDDSNSQENFQKFSEDIDEAMEQDKASRFITFTPETPEDKHLSQPSQKSFEEIHSGQHQFELATEYYSYKYTESIGVKLKGLKGGLTGAYQYHLKDNESIHSWNDFLNNANHFNRFRLEGRFGYGKVNYEGSGTWDGIPDLNFETRGLMGIDLPFEHFQLTPYGGVGYRYLLNKLSKYPAGFVGGQQYLSGYDRESHYIYLPLGLEAKTKLDPHWTMTLKGEFDIFVWGKQISHLENSVDINDVNAGIDQLDNTQKHGLGWRASARLAHETQKIDLFVEPFIRYWHIKDSEVSLVTYGGAANCNGNLCQAGLEPDNKTWEYGFNLGAKF